LVFRGGTALYKLFLPEPYRYSEDLDFVRTTSGGIGKVFDHITEIGNRLGYSVRKNLGKYPKVFWRGLAQTGRELKIKIEINTYERSPAMPLREIEHSVNTGWYSQTAKVKTFAIEELAATKIRALYQRAKGRDLFDLWVMLTSFSIDPDKVLAAFYTYRPENFSGIKAIANLKDKTSDPNIKADIESIVSRTSPEYDVNDAADLIIEKLLSKL
jgi:predicted nucleotidyltransferase component of viral defense system